MEKISIEEMTAKADVGRSTYFRYFKSKEEVLAFKIICLWKRFTEAHRADDASNGADELQLYFAFCLEIRPVTDLLYATGHQTVILDAYLQIAAPMLREDDTNAQYLAQFIIYGIFGLMNAWVLRGYQEIPEEMAEIVRSWTAASEGKEK